MSKMLKYFVMILLSFGAYANDIYITQSGAGLDLNITQDGNNNVLGTSSARVVMDGAGHVWTLSQVGDSNVISATIKGATYTGTWAITGNVNDIAFKCDSAGSSKCETVDVDVTVVGSYANIDIDIGENAAATNTNLTLAITGSYTTFNADIDGVSTGSQSASPVTVTLDSTCSSCGTNSSSNNIAMNVTQTGIGDSAGHKITYVHTGTGTVDLSQVGAKDNVIDMNITSTGADVDVAQSD
jgi:hypothetical protein